MTRLRPFLALAWMLLATASFTAMAISGREVRAEMSTFELMLYRSVIGWLIVSMVITRHPAGFAQIRSQRPGLHTLRNLFHFTAQNLWFYAIAAIPLAQTVALEMTNPIWVALIAPFLLSERLTRVRGFAALIGFAGVLVVVQPGVSPLHLGHAAALGSAIGFAMNTIFTKQIMRTDGVLCVLFWMTLAQSAMALVLSLPGGIPLPSPGLLPHVALIGITGLSAHFGLTKALGYAPATLVAPMEFLRLPVTAVAGMLIYGEPLRAAVFIGAALIIKGILLNLWSERGKQTG